MVNLHYYYTLSTTHTPIYVFAWLSLALFSATWLFLGGLRCPRAY
jgi:hypothetical protein